MEPNMVLAWTNLGLLIVGFITLWFSFGRKIGLLQSDLTNGLKSIEAHMNSYGMLLGALSKKTLTAPQVQEIQKPYLEHTSGEMLNPPEAQEFYNLSKKLEGEEAYKTDVGAILLVGLAAFVLGLVVGSSNGAAAK